MALLQVEGPLGVFRHIDVPFVQVMIGDDMSVVVYVVLTVAIFALLGLVQKLVEGL